MNISQPQIKYLAFDADDTLWECETLFQDSKMEICQLLTDYGSVEQIKEQIFKHHISRLPLYGYGVKGYILAILEVALHISDGQLPTQTTSAILAVGERMLQSPVVLLQGVKEVLENLHGKYELCLITKGDLVDQERKIQASGLAPFFKHIEVVSEKTQHTYAQFLEKYQIPAQEFMMIGNSLKSDVLPVLPLGATGVHVPYAITWEHEKVSEQNLTHPRLFQLDQLNHLYNLLTQLPNT